MDFKMFSSGKLLLKELRVFSELFSLLQHPTEPIKSVVPVMFIPGLMFNDLYLWPIILTFRQKGVRAYGWKMGINKGYDEKTKKLLLKRVDEILEKNNADQFIPVGWSMGGVYAREITHEHPKKVKFALTLATPFKIDGLFFEIIYKIISGKTLSTLNVLLEKQRNYEIPVVQLYTKEDGVIRWESCISPKYKNKEVKGTHLGMPFQKTIIEILKPSL